ncbi:MAG: hypothetical protein Q9213_005659 [Squamulea squamosa]
MVDTILADRKKYAHSVQFVKLYQPQPIPARAISVCSIDEAADDETAIDLPSPTGYMAPPWSGCFALSLEILINFKGVWTAGTERGKSRKGVFELLLAPDTLKWLEKGIFGLHFKLSFSEECYRMMVEANHTVNVLGDDSSNVKLVKVVKHMEDFKAQYPTTYYVYTPLGKGNLLDVMGMMHRDIKPQILAIKDYKNPVGFILVLDTVIESEEEHIPSPGTTLYMAPELLALVAQKRSGVKYDDMPSGIDASYSHSIDIWALGLCMFALENNGFPNWTTFSSHSHFQDLASDNGIPDNWVTRERWKGFSIEALGKMKSEAETLGNESQLEFLNLCQKMSNWDKDDRRSAQDAFETLDVLATSSGPGTLAFRSKGTKRDADQIS